MTEAPARVPLAVTTSGKPAEALVARARAAAQAWGVPFIARRKKEPLGPLLDTVADTFVVFEHEAVSLWDREGSFSFHPGMAHLRRKRMQEQVQQEDWLVRVAELRAGDQVLDCTLGLAQDALVAALAVGPGGRVVSLEKSLPLYAVVSEGLKDFDYGPDSCRVEPVHADASQYLHTLPARSFDIVFFDPMFQRPRKAQPSFDMLRRYAEHAPLTPEVLEEARRVARRWVVVKGSKYSTDLSRVGLRPELGPPSSTVVWGRVAGR